MPAAPDYVIATGDFISEWMADEGVNAAELARRLGVTRKHVSELLNGKAPLSHRIALALERVTGVPARIWNQYESGYRSSLARREEDEALRGQYDAAKSFPLAYLRKWGFISAPARDRAETVRQLLTILGTASLDAFDETWTRGSIAYRRAAVGRDHAQKLATWLALAERQQDGLHGIDPYDRAALKARLPELCALTRIEPTAAIRSATELLRAAGIVLCLIPAVPGLGIHGATRWLHGHPVIQLSVLWKSDDQLWFTLFHEIGHVLIHSGNGLFINGEDTAAEREADEFAAETLIPPAAERRLPRRRDIEAVEKLADEIGVAPSIVLGRAQRLTRDYAWGHALKRKIEFETPRRPPA